MEFPNIVELASNKLTDLTSIFVPKPKPTVKIYARNSDNKTAPKQILKTGYIMGINISEESVVANHPLENNTTFQDNIVTQPITVDIEISFTQKDYAEAWAILSAMVKVKNTIFTVAVGPRYIDNLVVKSIPTKRDPDRFNVIDLNVSFQEFIGVSPTSTGMSNPANVKMAQYVNREQGGLVKTITTSVTSYINQAQNLIGKFIK